MTNEARLLYKAILNRDLSPMFNRGVSDTWFKDDSDKRLFIFLRQHFANYSECPSVEVVKDNFPSFDETTVIEDDISYFIDAVVAERRKESTFNVIADAIKLMERDDDHEAAILAMQGGLAAIDKDGYVISRDIDLTKDPEARYDEYLNRKNIPDGILGHRTGFPTIDRSISGIQNGQLIVVAALPKTGKSTLCMQMAINMHDAGNSILFQSFEMTPREQASRYDAMRFKVSHSRLNTGTMIDEEESRYQGGLNMLAKFNKSFYLTDTSSGRTLTELANKIQSLQPDIIFIDGIYLMVDEQTKESNTPPALTNLTRGLKNLAQKLDKPIIINTQYLAHKTKNGKATLDSIGYASSFAQDADIVMGLEREDETIDDMRTLKIMASRNSGPAEITLTWEWDKGVFKEFDEGDLD
jgi:replicative DNA helicase